MTTKTEVEALRKQLAELSAQLAKLSGPVEETEQNMDEESSASEKLHADDYIKVMSLCSTVLNLNTMPYGKGGKVYRFPEFGSVKKILYKDLIDILEVNQNFLQKGFFIVLNRDAVRANGLDEIYAKILTKEKIDRILDGNESDAVNLFRSASEFQRETIIKLILEKMMNGLSYDLNLLDRLSRVVGPEYSIAQRFKQMREVADLHKQQT